MLHKASKNFSKAASKNREIGRLILRVIFTSLENQLECAAEFAPKALKYLFSVLAVFMTSENMSCIHIKQQLLFVRCESKLGMYFSCLMK